MKAIAAIALSLVVSSAVVLPSLHVVLRPPRDAYIRTDGPPKLARALLAEQVEEWDHGRRDVDRGVNPEWDLGHHTFFALSLVNVALESSGADRDTHRARVDAVLDELRSRPPEHFHLPYFRRAEFRDERARSLFLEGEVLLVLAARLIAWPDPKLEPELHERGRRVVEQMSQGPRAMGESYPDECWMFDNTLALAALAAARTALGRPIEGADALTRRWLEHANELKDPHTGILVASTTWDGRTLDGPEGSSAFAVAHFLQVVDGALAREQYDRATKELVERPLGFAYAHEWPDPDRWKGDPLPPRAGFADVDSGPVIPVVKAGAGASGMAILGAAAFHDEPLLEELVTSLELAAFPEAQGDRGDRLRFLASNPIGDAVMLYALVEGPLWQRIRPARVRVGRAGETT